MNKNIKILLVEDDKVDQMAFRRYIAAESLPYDLTVASSVAEAATAIGAGSFDVLIVDYSLGDGTAMDVLALTEGLPFVVMTGSGSEDIAVNLLKAGAYDYLIKDIGRNYLKILPITIAKSISHFKAEKRLQRYYEELGEKVRERTRDLAEANSSLEAALIKAMAGIKARDEFLANITHELVTPLNSIIGFSQILLDGFSGTLTDRQRQYTQAILESGERLNVAYSQILQVVGLESGKIQMNVTRFLCKNMLESALQMQREKAAKRDVTLTIAAVPPPETELEADYEQIMQVLFCLLDNAIKFNEAGGSVCVSARLENGGESIAISIADTGIGIKEEEIPTLFNSFQQLESVYTKKHQGVGLGLVLAQKLLEQHGGRIWVESEFGKGSTFTFLIPLRQSKKT